VEGRIEQQGFLTGGHTGGELTMPLGQKVVIVGGGHNGLVTAFYLAKGGFKPVVLERREMVGGGAVTEEFHPGFRVSTLAHTLGPLRADVARDLALEKFDCPIFDPDPRVFSPSPDGRGLLFYSDAAKTAGGIARVSAKDAENYTQFAKALEEIAGVFSQLCSITPPAIDKPTPEDLWNLFKTGRGVRGLGKKRIFDLLRWGPMAVADFVAEFFDTELIRATIAARGIFTLRSGHGRQDRRRCCCCGRPPTRIRWARRRLCAADWGISPVHWRKRRGRPVRRFEPTQRYSRFEPKTALLREWCCAMAKKSRRRPWFPRSIRSGRSLHCWIRRSLTRDLLSG